MSFAANPKHPEFLYRHLGVLVLERLTECGVRTRPQLRAARKSAWRCPGYTIAALSFLIAKSNDYHSAEGLDVELIAMRASTANLAVLGGQVRMITSPSRPIA